MIAGESITGCILGVEIWHLLTDPHRLLVNIPDTKELSVDDVSRQLLGIWEDKGIC